MLLSAHQTAQALLMMQSGIVIGFLYWILYPVRLLLKRSFVAVFLVDITFSLLAGVIFYLYLLASSYGELYFYSIFSSFAGFLLQYAAFHPIIEAIHHHRKKVKQDGGSQEAKKGKQSCSQKQKAQ